MFAITRPAARLSVLVFAVVAASACGDDDGGMTGNGGNQAPTAFFGDPLTFSWTVPSGTFVNGTSATDEVAQVTFPGAAPYTVTVEVDDGNGGTDSFSFTIQLS